MDMTELNALFNEYTMKKDVLDHGTKPIAEEIRSWCIDVYGKYLADEHELIAFLNAHKDIVTKTMYGKTYTNGSTFYENKNLTITSFNPDYPDHPENGRFVKVELTSECKNREHLGNYYSRHPHSKLWYYDLKDLENKPTRDVDYWVEVKKSLVILLEEFEVITRLVGVLVKNLIKEQDQRKDDITDALQTAMTPTEYEEVTIRIVKSH